MGSIDLVFFLGTLTIASCFIVIPKRVNGILKPLITFIIVLAIAQFLIEGYYWQFVPSYLLIALLILVAFVYKKTTNTTHKRILQIIFSILVFVSIVSWTIFLPIPKLTKPQGHYTVGTRIFRWIDFSRNEEITPDLNDKRNVVIQAWYPTEQNAKGTHSSYLDGMANLPEKVGIVPSFVFDHYDQIETYGVLDAPISKVQNQWPVIIFLTGNGAARAFYTSLAAGLASKGYVVLAIDHPYEAMITKLADGKVVTPIEVLLKDDPDLTKFMKARLDKRIADVRFVINQLENPKGLDGSFLSCLDESRIVIAGHSLGGASAAVAMAFDSRIKAAANIDGTLYGDLPKPNGPRPFLLLESRKVEGDLFLRYENGNQKFFQQFGGGYRYELIEADHYSFTDAPLLLAFPTRFIASRIFKIGNVPARTHNATVALLDTFFCGVLNNRISNIDSVASHFRGIIRRPID